MKLYQINAFTANGRGGNPAGVVLDGNNLSDLQMQTIATKAGFAETAFVHASNHASFNLRFFTPTKEVDLCGHATIAAWSLLRDRGDISLGTHMQRTKAGLLAVDITDKQVFMQQTPSQFYEQVDASELTSLLGLPVTAFVNALIPQIVSTGLRDLIVPIRELSNLAAIKPNLPAICAFSKQHAISGLHVFTLNPNAPSMAAARNFAPADGIDEEVATGTSNGALLCYLKKYKVLKSTDVYRIEQGASMNQLSYIYGKFVDSRVWIGGDAKLMNEHLL